MGCADTQVDTLLPLPPPSAWELLLERGDAAAALAVLAAGKRPDGGAADPGNLLQQGEETITHAAKILHVQQDPLRSFPPLRDVLIGLRTVIEQDPSSSAAWILRILCGIVISDALDAFDGRMLAAVDDPQGEAGLRELRRCRTIAGWLADAATGDEATVALRYLSMCHQRIGSRLLRTGGDLAEAIAALRASLAAAERINAPDALVLAASSPLALALQEDGDLAGALQVLTQLQSIAERIQASLLPADQPPAPPGTQAELDTRISSMATCLTPASYRGSMAEIRSRLGDDAGAIADALAYRDYLRHMSAMEPEQPGWQRDLIPFQAFLGDLLLRQGDHQAAQEAFAEGSLAARRLATCDRLNLQWWSDICFFHRRIATIRWRHGDAAGALAACEVASCYLLPVIVKVQEHPAVREESGTLLSLIGLLHRELKNDLRAGKAFCFALAIFDPLSRSSVRTHRQMARLHQDMGFPSVARIHADQGLAVIQQLRAQDPDDADLALEMAFVRLVVCELCSSESDIRAHFEATLAIAQRFSALDAQNEDWPKIIDSCRSGLGESDQGGPPSA